MNQLSSAYEVIESHNQSIQVSLYTPAHQGIARQNDRLSQEIYRYDVPFLTRPRTEGVERHFSRLYGTKHTFALTGGGTQGVLTACALLGTGYQKVAIAANIHISTINGIILAGLEPHIIPSRSWMPTTEEIIAALEARNVSALLLTHPSYEGITIDLVRIAAYCRQHDIVLAIDEAHGSHFPFLDDRWQSAIAVNADIVTHSMHKYTGSLVQTALLHLPEGSRFTREEAMSALSLFETTTRSNLLLLSLENAIEFGFTDKGRALLEKNILECDRLRAQLDCYGSVLTYNRNVCDPLKIYLQSDRVTGEGLEELLYERGIDGEYAEEEGILLIFSFNHDRQHFQLLSQVFADLVSILTEKPAGVSRGDFPLCRHLQMRMLPKNAFFAPKEKLVLENAIGKTSSCCIKKVPPGIPILIPGEIVTSWHLENLSADTSVIVVQESSTMSVEQTQESSEDRPWLSWICDSQGTNELQNKYDTWANTYDEDISQDWAFMPDKIAATASQLLRDPNVSILDAGAGTGLVGMALAQKGYTNLTAIDLSEKMLAIAREKQVYQQLYQGNLEDSGILQNLEPFEAIVAAGVFAYAHAGAGVLNNLFRFLKVGGFFLLTIREDYRQQMQTDLEKLPWKLVSEENFPIYNGEKLMYLLAFQKERSQ